MALPASGAINLGDVNVELLAARATQRSLGQSTTRSMFNVPSGAIRLAADGYGKAFLAPTYLGLTFLASTTPTITIPATHQVGDFVILVTFPTNNNSVYPANNNITGWTKYMHLQNAPVSNFYSVITAYYKILTAGDPGSTITYTNGNEYRAAYLVAFRAQRAFQGVTLQYHDGRYQNTDIPQLASNNIVSTGARPLIAFGHSAVNLAFTPTVTTNLTSGDIVPATHSYAAYRIFLRDSVLQEVNIDMTDPENFNSMSLSVFAMS